jgi:hypothetical protein
MKDSCLARVITVTSSKEIIQKADKYTHSNRLVERKVRKVEQDNKGRCTHARCCAPLSLGDDRGDFGDQFAWHCLFHFTQANHQQENPLPEEIPEGISF